MGLSSSKPDNATTNEAMSMELVLDKGVKQQIDKLSEYVSYFNSNDVTPLIKVIDDYKMNLETSTGRQYDLNNVKTFVGKFHQELLDKIGKDFPDMSDQEKQTKLSERLRDKSLPDYLKNIYDNKLGDLRAEVLKSPLVQKDSKMSQNIERLFTDITGIKSKYKYFEYRYIQLNLFLIVFIQHTFNTMDKFINSVLAYTVTRDTYRSDSLKKLIELLLQIMRQAELDIDQKDFESIEALMSVVEGSIKDKQVKLNQAVEKARVDALDEMLKLVMAHHDVFSDKIADEFGRPGNAQRFEQYGSPAPSRSSRPLGPGSSVPNVTPRPSNQMGDVDEMFGGFLRDHSRLPQAFYDINK